VFYGLRLIYILLSSSETNEGTEKVVLNKA